MSDEALRGGERRWRGAGGAEALARLVQARVRAGTLPDEAARVAEQLAAGTTTVEGVLVAGLVGHPWARELVEESLAEACAYHGVDAALADGPPTLAGLVDLLLALHAIGGRRALGEALVAVGRRARAGVVGPPPIPGGHGALDGQHAFQLQRIDSGLDMLEALHQGASAPVVLERLVAWSDARGAGDVYQVRRLVGETANVLALADSSELASALRAWCAATNLVLSAMRDAIRDAVGPRRLGLTP